MIVDLKNLQCVYHARYDAGSKTYTVNGVTFTCYYSGNGLWVRLDKNATLQITQNNATLTNLLNVAYTAGTNIDLRNTYPYAGVEVYLQ